MDRDYSEMQDEELALMAKENEQAYNVLHRRYEKKIKSIIKRQKLYLTNGDIDDLCQEGFIGLSNAVKGYKKGLKFASFASKCIKASIYTLINKSNTQKELVMKNYISLSNAKNEEDDINKSSLMIDKGPTPEESYINNETSEEIIELISKELSKMEYKIFVMNDLGYTYTDIAKELNISEKSVDNALQRAKNKIKKLKGKKEI